MNSQPDSPPALGSATVPAGAFDELPPLVPLDDLHDSESLAPTSPSAPQHPLPTAANADNNASQPQSRVPITVITGFLGSGKTTLLNYILSENHGKKIAVILNEFGDSQDMEKSLSVAEDGHQAEEWMELRNGCLCCSVKDTGVRAIEALMQKRGKFDYILLETTGLADPQPIISTFWTDADLCADIYLDGVVTVVDAKNVARNLVGRGPFERETVRQIAMADRIVLNKMDLVPAEELEGLRREVRRVNGVAPMYATERSRIDLDLILDLHAFDERDPVLQDDSIDQVASTADNDGGGAVCTDAGCNGDHDHHAPPRTMGHMDASVSSVSLTLPHTTSRDAITRWLGALVWDFDPAAASDAPANVPPPMELWRVKGKLRIAGEPNVVLLQGVADLFELLDTRDPWPPGAHGESHIVVIGRYLRRNELQAGLVDACPRIG